MKKNNFMAQTFVHLSSSLRRTLVRPVILFIKFKIHKSKTKRVTFIYLLLFTFYFSNAQLVDKTPAAIPNAPSIYNTEPYEDPAISGINRDASRVTAYSYTTVNDALKND